MVLGAPGSAYRQELHNLMVYLVNLDGPVRYGSCSLTLAPHANRGTDQLRGLKRLSSAVLGALRCGSIPLKRALSSSVALGSDWFGSTDPVSRRVLHLVTLSYRRHPIASRRTGASHRAGGGQPVPNGGPARPLLDFVKKTCTNLQKPAQHHKHAGQKNKLLKPLLVFR